MKPSGGSCTEGKSVDAIRLVEGEINQYEELISGIVGGIAAPDLLIAAAVQ